MVQIITLVFQLSNLMSCAAIYLFFSETYYWAEAEKLMETSNIMFSANCFICSLILKISNLMTMHAHFFIIR